MVNPILLLRSRRAVVLLGGLAIAATLSAIGYAYLRPTPSSTPSPTPNPSTTPIPTFDGLNDHSYGDIHGLSEINQAAQEFLQQENRKNHTQWLSEGPNLKVIVPRCTTALRARWASEQEANRPKVWVYCDHAVDGEKWRVVVGAAPSPEMNH